MNHRFAASFLAAMAMGGASGAGAADTQPRVQLETNMGNIVLELNRAKAPGTVDNFLSYVKDGFYSGTVFHRVISNFMIQGGGFTEDLQQKPTKATIKNEANNGLKNVRGSIAMARTSAPHSASSQFFINVVDNSFLDYPGQDGFGYAVFGTVVEGMDVVDKIRNTPTGSKAPLGRDVPQTTIVIKAAKVLAE